MQKISKFSDICRNLCLLVLVPTICSLYINSIKGWSPYLIVFMFIFLGLSLLSTSAIALVTGRLDLYINFIQIKFVSNSPLLSRIFAILFMLQSLIILLMGIGMSVVASKVYSIFIFLIVLAIMAIVSHQDSNSNS